MSQNEERNPRKIYMDFLRIIAIYMVLFNHTKTNGFVLFTVRQNSPFFWLYLFNAIFIKIAVPLFFMISGALLIEKEESIKQLIVNRFLKYLIVLVVCSVVQYFYTCHINHSALSFSDFFTELYTGSITVAYWYLYAYLAFLLMLPLLRCFGRTMTDKHFLWMFIMYGFFKSLSIVEFLIWQGSKTHNGSFSFFVTTNYVFYPLMGYYIDRIMKNRLFNRKTLVLLTITSIGAISICCFMTQYKCSIIGEWEEDTCQTFFNTLIFLPAITVFFAAKMWFMNHRPKERICRLIELIGGTTFGIFLFENIFRRVTIPIFRSLEPMIKTLPACWVRIFAACLLGSVITLLLKQIPGVKRFL